MVHGWLLTGESWVDQVDALQAAGNRVIRYDRRSRLHVIAGGPHGINVSHADEFNEVLLTFLDKEFVQPNRLSLSDA